jgi:hypothetical protein
MTPEEEEQARIDRARTGGGILAPKPPPPPAPPASAPNISFTKGWTPADRAKQAAAYQKFLRDRGEQ